MAASAGFHLSPQQKYIWSSAASARSQLAVLIEGELDESRLRAALGEVVKRNEALRTVFQRQIGMKFPIQMVLDESEAAWSSKPFDHAGSDIAATAHELMHTEAAEPMPAEASQLRSTLFTLGEGQTLWLLTAHSAIADAWSMQIVAAQTLKFYSGEKDTAEEPLRYVQFGQWQNDLLAEEDEAAKEAGKFWAAQAGSSPSIPGEIEETSSSSGVQTLKIAVEGYFAKAALAIGGEASASDVVLAAWTAVIARWTGQAGISLGTVLEGREYEELQGLVGAVSKMAPMNVVIKGQPSFAEWVSQIHAQRDEMTNAQEHYAPEKPFKVGYEFIVLAEPLAAAGVKFSPLYVGDRSHSCALKLNVCGVAKELRVELQYRPDLISADTAAEIAQSLQAFLEKALASPQTSVSSLPIISASRKSALLLDGAGASVPYPSLPIQALISGVTNAPAVRSGSDVVSYGELDQRSNQLAHYLAKVGVKRGSLVGLCVARTAGMMTPVLGILKAGGAYVPLSADQPKARTAQQLEDLDVVVTEAQFVDYLPAFAGQLVVLDGADRPWEQEPDTAVDVEVCSDDLAYVIYTSGSTGTPKGVGVKHGNLVNYATHIVRALELAKEPLQYATVSTLAADLGNTVIYPALLTGGCLHVLPYETATDAKQMAAYQAEYKIDVLKIVPSHLAALVEAGGEAVLPKKFLITGGEALKPALVERVSAHCEVVNHYGPTETTVGSLMLRLKDFDWKAAATSTVPIGRPIANTRVYVLDQNRELVPVGVAGELYIAGAGVSAGYVGQPEMTAERFVLDPFVANERMYRTGDLVRWLPSGVVEFLGRADDQVKIRGFRVELGEIETVLAKEPGVRQCVVIARGKAANPDDKQVVAYVVLDRQQGTTTEILKQALKDRLPDYMVPSAIVDLAKLPLTANGKVDRKNLPEPEERVREYKAPSTVTEELVAQIWAEVLKLDRISTDESFFDLGGHSLLATQVISRVREAFKLEIALKTMFEAPVLSDFAAAVDKLKASGVVSAASGPIKRAARQEYRA